MDHIGLRLTIDKLKDKLCRFDVIPYEFIIIDTADLGLQHHNDIRTAEMILPISGLRDVGIFHSDVRMHLPQYSQIFTVFVENNDVGVSTLFKAGNKILTH